MKWIKASERLPEKFDRVNWRYEITKIPISYRTSYKYAINKDKSCLVEWLDESPSGSEAWVSVDFLSVLEENYEAAKRMVDEDKARPAQEIVLETYEDLISIYKAKYKK